MAVGLHTQRCFDIAGFRDDLNEHSRAANTHRCNRRFNAHVAVFRGLPCDERNSALDEADECGIRRSIWIVDHFVQNHAGVRRHTEGAAINQRHCDRGVRARLNDVTFLHGIADIQLDGDAITNDAGATRQLHHMADHLRGVWWRGLCVLNVPGERRYDVPRQHRAVFGDQCWARLALEIVVDGVLLIVRGQDEIVAGAGVVAIEEQMLVGNNDPVRAALSGHALRIKRELIAIKRNRRRR